MADATPDPASTPHTEPDTNPGADAESEAPDVPGPSPRARRRKKIRWRQWLRALHRDFGYIAVGLTFIYALSGLAVNHLSEWDPNFVNYEREFQVEAPLPDDDARAAAIVLEAAQIDEEPVDVYRVTDEELEITLKDSSLYVSMPDGKVVEEGQQERPFLRVANWLHLNRGKKAWTWFADGYAIVLLFLASSGLFMLPGRKGLLGRGAILVALGVLIPVIYLNWFGSPP